MCCKILSYNPSHQALHSFSLGHLTLKLELTDYDRNKAFNFVDVYMFKGVKE